MNDDEARKAIEGARRSIDEIDEEIVRLLNRRAEAVQRIGRAKHVLDEPIYQPEREERIFARVTELNGGPLDDGAIRRLFERVLDEARRLERFTYEFDDDE